MSLINVVSVPSRKACAVSVTDVWILAALICRPTRPDTSTRNIAGTIHWIPLPVHSWMPIIANADAGPASTHAQDAPGSENSTSSSSGASLSRAIGRPVPTGSRRTLEPFPHAGTGDQHGGGHQQNHGQEEQQADAERGQQQDHARHHRQRHRRPAEAVVA